MASKKKPNRPRPPSGQRGAPKPGGARPAGPKPPAARPATSGAGSTGPAAPSKAGTPKPGPTKPGPAKPGATKPGPASAGSTSGKNLTRAERLAAAEKARRSKATRTRALIAGVLVAIVALITVTVIQSRRSNDRTVTKLEAGGSCAYDTKADTDSGAGNNHVEGDVKYTVDPPAGGNHNPTAAAAGTYTTDNTPPDGQLVHALEHGYVIIWHRPDIAAASLDDLRTLAGRYGRDVLLVPRASLKQPVAATAWHHRLLCSQPDLQALDLFVTTYRNKGPERIPH
jgi:hypothetical protein